MKDVGAKDQDPFVALVPEDDAGGIAAYLVNPSGRTFVRVDTLSGMFATGDEGLIESSQASNRRGALGPRVAMLLERSPGWERDFVIWYALDLYPEGSRRVDRYSFTIPKYLGESPRMVELIDQPAHRIELERRTEGPALAASD
jgi:hypothetical protein